MGVCSGLKQPDSSARAEGGVWTGLPDLMLSTFPSLCLHRLCAPGPQAHEEPGGGPRLPPRVSPQPCLSRTLRHSPEGFGDSCPALLTQASPGATVGAAHTPGRGPGCGFWNLQGCHCVHYVDSPCPAPDSEWLCWLGLLQASGIARGPSATACALVPVRLLFKPWYSHAPDGQATPDASTLSTKLVGLEVGWGLCRPQVPGCW